MYGNNIINTQCLREYTGLGEWQFAVIFNGVLRPHEKLVEGMNLSSCERLTYVMRNKQIVTLTMQVIIRCVLHGQILDSSVDL